MARAYGTGSLALHPAVRRERVSVRGRPDTASPIPATTDRLDEPTDPGLAKDARDLQLPPWNKGHYGTAIGRAVHGVLQSVDLATGRGLGDAVAAQVLAEGVGEQAEIVAALARSACGAGFYRPQLAAYAAALSAATSKGVARAVLVFLAPAGVVELTLDEMDEAVDRLREQIHGLHRCAREAGA